MHFANASLPILFIPLPKFTEVNLIHVLNALSSMDITLSGIVIDVNLLQPVNACEQIDVTPSLIVIVFISFLQTGTISSIFLFSILLPIVKCPVSALNL